TAANDPALIPGDRTVTAATSSEFVDRPGATGSHRGNIDAKPRQVDLFSVPETSGSVANRQETTSGSARANYPLQNNTPENDSIIRMPLEPESQASDAGGESDHSSD